MMQLNLCKNWKMKKCGEDEIYNISVPNSVYSVLIENNKINHPHFEKENLDYYKDIDGEYEFETSFEVSEEMLGNKQVELVFEGLDTVCDVYLNNAKIGYFCNMHAVHRIPVKEYLKNGENELKVHFYSPLEYIAEKDREKNLKENSYGMPGFSQIRKAHYMFGWDWGPTVPDIGIWKPVYLEGNSTARLDSVYITQEHSGLEVKLNISPDTVYYDDCKAEYEITVTSPEGEKKTLKSDGDITIDIDNPKLWYPNGYGEQPLYTVEVVLCCGGVKTDSKEYVIGLRTIELVNEDDESGKSFYFRVNGFDVFAKGANYIPEDNLLGNRREKAEHILKSCHMANFNMIRIWGGGVYMDDEFYKRCCEYGLLVWQDFMFACVGVNYTDEFVSIVTEEITCQLKRLRNYPCFALWAGNNECEDMLCYGSPEGDEKLSTERADYIKMFHCLIPGLMKKFHPTGIYKSSSPTSDTCFYKPYDPDRGDVHFWEVWHALKPFSEYRKHLFRFCSEFGFQSLPCIETIKTFAEEKDLNLFSPVMEIHQKFEAGNNKILHYLAENFRYPESFESLVYLSQILQGEAIGSGVEHWRSNRGICMGSLYWQLNDCWPGVSWSGMDYYGRWKALHYFAKRFYAPVLVTAYEENSELYFAVSSDINKKLDIKIEWKLMDMDGNVLCGNEMVSQLNPLSAMKLEKQIPDVEYKKDNCYVSYSLSVDGAAVTDRVLMLYENKRYDFRKPDIKTQIDKDENGIYITLSSDCLARYVKLSANDNNTLFDDNFFDIVPGREKKVYISDNTDIDIIKNTLNVMTLYDVL